MSLTISVPQLDKHATTKDYVVTILSSDWPLTVKKLHWLLKKRYAKSVSYQAVYKTVQELLSENVLQRVEDGYQIDLRWLKQIHRFTELVESNYFTRSRVDTLGLKDAKTEGSLNVLTFQNWFDAEKYLYYLQKHTVLTTNKKLALCVHHRHDWRPLFYLRAEYNWCKKLHDLGHDVYFLCAGNGKVDAWSAAFYRQIGVNVKNNVSCAQTCELMVFADTVIQVYIPSELQEAVDTLCKQNPHDVDIPWAITRIFEKPSDVRVVITKDKKMADDLIKQTVERFKR